MIAFPTEHHNKSRRRLYRALKLGILVRVHARQSYWSEELQMRFSAQAVDQAVTRFRLARYNRMTPAGFVELVGVPGLDPTDEQVDALWRASLSQYESLLKRDLEKDRRVVLYLPSDVAIYLSQLPQHHAGRIVGDLIRKAFEGDGQ